jgi:hypothetical protein
VDENNAILVVGSVAFDDVETPFGKVDRVLGGSTLYFSAAASFFAPVRVVSVVGRDMNLEDLRFLQERGVDLTGLQVEDGKTFASPTSTSTPTFIRACPLGGRIPSTSSSRISIRSFSVRSLRRHEGRASQ